MGGILIDFTVPGQPYGKGRPRAGKTRAGKVVLYTPEKTVSYEYLVAIVAQQAMKGRPLLTGPVDVFMSISLEIPASWSKLKQQRALAGQIRPTTKPDIDNVEKAIYDAVNGIVWKDDVQVVDVAKRKQYSLTPGVVVQIKATDGVL